MATNPGIVRIFEYALAQEETGKAFFEHSLERMGSGAAVGAFRRLIEEEAKHIAFITQILDNLRRGMPLEPSQVGSVALEPSNYFDERAKSEFLQQCIEGSMIPDVTVFNTAWLIEKDLSDFYENMAGRAEGKAQEALLMLADWEKSHERFFKEYRDKITEIYARMPWGG